MATPSTSGRTSLCLHKDCLRILPSNRVFGSKYKSPSEEDDLIVKYNDPATKTTQTFTTSLHAWANYSQFVAGLFYT